jgi:hypothetical protein
VQLLEDASHRSVKAADLRPSVVERTECKHTGGLEDVVMKQAEEWNKGCVHSGSAVGIGVGSGIGRIRIVERVGRMLRHAGNLKVPLGTRDEGWKEEGNFRATKRSTSSGISWSFRSDSTACSKPTIYQATNPLGPFIFLVFIHGIR